MILGHLSCLKKLAYLFLGADESPGIVLFHYGNILLLGQKEERSWAVHWVLMPEMVS